MNSKTTTTTDFDAILAKKKARKQAAQKRDAGPSQQELDKFQERAAKADGSLRAVEGSVSDLTKSAERAGTSISSLEDDARQLRLTLTSVSGDVEAASADAGRLGSRLTELGSDVSGLETRASEAEGDVRAAETSVEQVGDRPAALLSSLESAEENVRIAVDEVGNRPAQLQTILTTTEETITNLETHAAEVGRKLETAEIAVDNAVERIGNRPADVQEKLKTAEDAVDALGERPERLEENLANAESRISQVDQTLTDERLEQLKDVAATVDAAARAHEKQADADPQDLMNVTRREFDELSRKYEELRQRVETHIVGTYNGFVEKMIGKLNEVGVSLDAFGQFEQSSELLSALETALSVPDENQRLDAVARVGLEFGRQEVLNAAGEIKRPEEIELLAMRSETLVADQDLLDRKMAYFAVEAACDENLQLNEEQRLEALLDGMETVGPELVVPELKRWAEDGSGLAEQMLGRIEQKAYELVQDASSEDSDEEKDAAFKEGVKVVGEQYMGTALMNLIGQDDQDAIRLREILISGDGQ